MGRRCELPNVSISHIPNISLMSLALSPMYLSTMALETTFRKLASSCLATARASSVLPVPTRRRKGRKRERGRGREGKEREENEGDELKWKKT